MSQFDIRSESFGAGDQSWMGSTHGIDSAKSVTLDPAAWSGKLTDDKVLRSGEAMAIVDGLAVPYVAGTNTLSGFLLTDQTIRPNGGNATVPCVWHGRIKLSKLPSPVLANATTTGLFLLEA